MDLLDQPAWVEELLERITGIQVTLAKRFVVLGVDGGYFGDDYGAQRGLLFSPRLWRQMIKPRLARMFAVFREALHILEQGIATAEDIDAAMTAGPGLRYGFLGPLRTADLGGLDVFHAISRYLLADLGAEDGPPILLERLVAEGRTASFDAGIVADILADFGHDLLSLGLIQWLQSIV
jgi:hypothetical protein